MPSDALTLKYTPRTSTREYNTFTEEYFSGADISLYLNNEKMTQVSGLQYSVQEQLKPIYGYASRTFDDVAIGVRLVVGTFKVPITNPEQNMNVDIKIEVPSLDEQQSNEKIIKLPSWAVNNTSYNNIKHINQGREYNDPKNTGQSNAMINSYIIKNKNNNDNAPLRYSEETLRIQKKLLELAYNIDLTGIYDLKTRRAVKSFQESCHINATGSIDDETMGYLFKNLEKGFKYGFIIDSNATLRLGPNSSYKTISSNLPIHTRVQIIEEEGEWYKIKLDDKQKGFVAKIFISVVK